MEGKRKEEDMQNVKVKYGTCRYCMERTPNGFSMCEACWDRFEEPRVGRDEEDEEE